MFRISSSSRRRSAAAAGPLQSALLLLAAASTCAASVLEERDIGFCMSVRDCFNTHAYLPENADYVCTARRSCSYSAFLWSPFKGHMPFFPSAPARADSEVGHRVQIGLYCGELDLPAELRRRLGLHDRPDLAQLAPRLRERVLQLE